MRLSIVIPALNEADRIGPLIEHLREHADERLAEVIVVDGRSGDATVERAREAGAKTVSVARRCRAAQMNAGARTATGDVLYFVHADTAPPAPYLHHIAGALDAGYDAGCYRSTFDPPLRALAFNAWCTRFDRLAFRGGDQTLFVRRAVFDSLGGFSERHVVMEDYDFLQRLRPAARFRILPHGATISARKYDENSYLRVNLANTVVFAAYRLGVAPERLQRLYHRLLKHPKDEALDPTPTG